ncbi:MAG: NeuD/PglB/VioB family sugar acetyltransferase [Lachnospiraceae bacterium]|nr:NeuD/PglB/VioB family sugar acetyltransferase [Lachnospiraceae bacterium]
MSKIKMPRLGVNDDYVTLVAWLVEDGSWVKKGQVIAEVETSKEASEVKSDAEGSITFTAKEGEDINVDSVIALIGEGEKPEEKEGIKDNVRMTDKARKLVEDNKIDITLLPKDTLIREKDILPFIKKAYTIAPTKQNELLLYGAGGFSKIAIDILKVSHAYNTYGIIDMAYPDLDDVMGVSVVGGDVQLQDYYDKGYRKVFNCVGINRKKAYDKLKEYNFDFPNIVHARAILEPSVSIGEGNLICAGAIIGAEAQIGNDCVINAGAIISHDCIISDHCHIASGATLAGLITVGENTLIGQNVTIYSRVKIGNNVVIENGCSVFKNVPDNTVVRYNRGN